MSSERTNNFSTVHFVLLTGEKQGVFNIATPLPDIMDMALRDNRLAIATTEGVSLFTITY